MHGQNHIKFLSHFVFKLVVWNIH